MFDQMRGGGFRVQGNRNLRGLILLNFLCVVFLAICGTIFVFFYSDSSEANQTTAAKVVVERQPTLKMVDVLIPVRPIDSGEALKPSMFKQEPRPESVVSERIVRDFAEINGGYARSPIMPGEPLSRDYLTAVKPSGLITGNIPEGYRAISININATTGVEGWARPGARVDVSWLSGTSGKHGLTIIVQNALVLSADRNPNPNADPSAPVPTTVTLLVSAKDAAKIQLAASRGTVSLALRGERDHGKTTNFSTINENDLLGRSSQDEMNGDNVEGFVRFSTKDGKTEEMVIMNGQVVRRAINR